MKTCLIQSSSKDLHTRVVAAALAERDVPTFVLDASHIPQRVEFEYRYCGVNLQAQVHADGKVLDLADVATVWRRRPQRIHVPEGVAPEDQQFAYRENAAANDSIEQMLRDRFWINPGQSARACDLKPFQLATAQHVGLTIPPTLIGNCPDHIRAYIRSFPTVIYKALSGHLWHENGQELACYTSRVRVDDLPPDALLRATPGIFQRLVPKQYEVRAQFFGASCLAARIESSKIEYGEFDWRLHQISGVHPQPIEVPEAIQRKCRALMKSLGIVAGGFDFIVTPGDEWVFVEVNEAGQFLFLEQWCPDLSIIDAFCAFIQSRDSDFRYRSPRRPQRLTELLAALPELPESNVEQVTVGGQTLARSAAA